MRNFFIFFIPLAILLASAGCNEENIEKAGVIKEQKQKNSGANIVKFKSRLFNVPSPVQVSKLVSVEKLPYNEQLLNPFSNYQNYSSSFKQALNFGVYGADLAYLNLYEQYNTAADYYKSIKKLSEELNIDDAFTKEVLDKIENNNQNKDSLLRITSAAYKNADSYLIENERNDISILILAGSWVESMYILTSNAQKERTDNITEHIGQQKYALENLIELMRPYYNQKSKEYDEFLLKLSDLALLFDGVTTEYKFEKSEIDKKNKTTTIKSKTKITISEYQLKKITETIAQMRTLIIE